MYLSLFICLFKSLYAMKQNIFVIIVLFNPKVYFILKTLDNLADFNVILVDNSPQPSFSNTRFNANVRYYALNNNTGIAYAQNVGILNARQLNAEYIVFFDQDSLIENSLIHSLHQDYLKIKSYDCYIGALGPLVYDKDNGVNYDARLRNNESQFMVVDRIISSGMFLETNTIDAVGMMKSDLFIDYIDSEFCWRLNNNGYHCYIDKNVSMAHKIGICQKRIGKFKVIISSPIRYYYQYRNFIYLCGYEYVPKSWKIKNFIRKLFELFYVPLVVGKISIFKYMIKGIFAGFKKIVYD